MKKGKICIGTVLLILSLVCLTGCSSQEPEETTARQTTSAAETSEKGKGLRKTKKKAPVSSAD